MEITRGRKKQAERVVVYGPEGIGKSTFAAAFPDPLFIDTEGSTSDLDVARLPDPKTWNDVVSEIGYVLQHPECCKTLVIDTADWSEKLCARFVCEKKQVSGIEEFGYGKGYVYLAEEFQRFLRALNKVSSLGIHVVLTAHAQMRKFEQPDEAGAYDRWELKLEKKTAPLLKEWATMLLFANYKTLVIKDSNNKAKARGGKRVMYTEHHPCWDAKNRKGLPAELPFSFDSIAEHIASDLREETPKKVPAQVKAEPDPQAEFIPTKQELLMEVHKRMNDGGYDDELIRRAVASRNYYPVNTKVSDYSLEFIQGVLIGAWDKISAVMDDMIQNDVPF